MNYIPNLKTYKYLNRCFKKDPTIHCLQESISVIRHTESEKLKTMGLRVATMVSVK